MGADYVINYKEDEKWGETARSFTPNNTGVQHVVEVSGPKTIGQVSCQRHIAFVRTVTYEALRPSKRLRMAATSASLVSSPGTKANARTSLTA